jgi:hypothetical protein
VLKRTFLQDMMQKFELSGFVFGAYTRRNAFGCLGSFTINHMGCFFCLPPTNSLTRHVSGGFPTALGVEGGGVAVAIEVW